MKIYIEADKTRIVFDYNYKIVQTIQRFPKRNFDRGTKEWIVPSCYAEEVVRQLLPFGFEVEGIPVVPQESFEETLKCKYLISEEKSEITLSFPYDVSLVEAIKSVPGREWDSKNQQWKIPLTFFNILNEKVLTPYNFSTEGKNLVLETELTNEKIYDEKEYETIKNNFLEKVKPILKMELKSFQEHALVLSLMHSAYGLFLQQRVGKTPVALAYVVYRRLFNGSKKSLFICENSLLYQFENEVKKWTNLKPLIVTGSKAKRAKLLLEDADIYLVNYHTLDMLKDELIQAQFDIIIADESQNFKNGKAKRTKAGIDIAKNAAYKIILTGTPITRAPEDFFYQFKFLNPNYLGFKSYWLFLERYCHFDHFKNITGYKNLPELQKNAGKYSIRYTRKDVRNDLPEKVYETRIVQMTAEQKRQYKQMNEDLILEISEIENVTAPVILTKLLRLTQITSGHFLEQENPKLNELMSIITDSENSDDKITVWCRFRESIDLIENALIDKNIKYHMINGDVLPEERFKIIQDFNFDDSKVIVVQIQTAKVGTDLSGSSICVFFENDWNYGNRVQAEDRNQTVHKDMTKNVLYIDLVASESEVLDDSIDSIIIEALQKKQEYSDILVDKRLEKILKIN